VIKLKIAIPSEGNTLESQASQFFGRCPYFIIAVVEDGKLVDWEAFPNPALEQAGGAGIMAAQFIAEKGASKVIASAVGPKAGSALDSLDINIIGGFKGTVKDNIEKLIAGELGKAGNQPPDAGPYGQGASGRKAPGTGMRGRRRGA